jgi:AbrB family looped-hinge helix DNA binding protein
MSKISSRGQIILPAKIRREDGIEAGQEFEVQRVGRGEYLLRRRVHRPNEGLVKLLLACPIKGWFQPMDRTETTADTTPPKLG